jgi:SAM-dependent methyltransferase
MIAVDGGALSPAAHAFDAIAGQYDAHFSGWQSVAAQRRAVRAALVESFAPGAALLEIGAGTGEDAAWLADRGYRMTVTDPSPQMVRIAAAKLAGTGASALVIGAEALERLAKQRTALGEARFDGAFSNFAGLNCVSDLAPVGRGLAGLVRADGSAILVLFGTACPGETIVEALRGRPGNMLRRRVRTAVPARLGGHEFTVAYHRMAAIDAAMAPWFVRRERRGIGVFVPPSAAEPWISGHRRLLAGLEAADRLLARPLAAFGDHVLYRYERNGVPV